jgi:co-chaperonin GroES (HSP10)
MAEPSSTTTPKLHITPEPGELLCKKYSPQDVFVPVREEVGEAQVSVIMAIGDSVVDNNNVVRDPNDSWEVGTIIYHQYSSNDFEWSKELYRFVNFSKVLGVKHGS